jgi:hypothetical protein
VCEAWLVDRDYLFANVEEETSGVLLHVPCANVLASIILYYTTTMTLQRPRTSIGMPSRSHFPPFDQNLALSPSWNTCIVTRARSLTNPRIVQCHLGSDREEWNSVLQKTSRKDGKIQGNPLTLLPSPQDWIPQRV